VIKVGCCGLQLKLSEYVRRLPVLEIDRSFYRLPKPSTAMRWREEAGESFEFALKAWQVITHPATSPTYRRAAISVESKENCGFFQPTREVLEAWERTKEVAQSLKAFAVLFQCPPSFVESERNISNMRRFFTTIDAGRLLLIWEPRGGWSTRAVEGLCRELGLVHCVDPLYEQPALEGRVAYFRLHGSRARGRIDYRHSYTDEELRLLAELCRGSSAEKVYVLFNNLSMLRDAERFSSLL